jgi:hypothetical protein
MDPLAAASTRKPAESASLRSAATVTRTYGVRVHVLVPRRAGVVTLARDIAVAMGVRVEVDLRAAVVCVTFASNDPNPRKGERR